MRLVQGLRDFDDALDFGRRSAAVAGIGLTTVLRVTVVRRSRSARSGVHSMVCSGFAPLVCGVKSYSVLWSQDMCQANICLPHSVSNTTD